MATKNKDRITLEILPGQKRRLEDIAKSLGYLQVRGPQAGEGGSISQLVQAIAAGEVEPTRLETERKG